MRAGHPGLARRKMALMRGLALLLAITLASCRDASNPGPPETPQPTDTAPPPATQPALVASDTPAASSTTAGPLPTVTPHETTTPSPPTVVLPPTPTATVPVAEIESPERSQYALVARLDYERHHLDVAGTITTVNRSPEPWSDLLLVVEANRRPGAFTLNRLSWADGRPVEGYGLEGAQLRVRLPGPLAPGASVGLDLSFELDLPSGPSPLGYTARQTNLGDWYPYVPPYRAGQGWLVHEPWTFGEHLVYDVADYQVEIQLDAPAMDLTIAASGLVESDGNRYQYRLEAARSFAWSVSPEYVVLHGSTDGVAVASYAFPEHRAAGEAVLNTTIAAVGLYGELFGPYPHTELAAVEADFFDGMEYDGLYFLGSSYYAAYAEAPRGYLVALAAHETAHEWWYGLVGNDQAQEPWLDEALAAYSERLFYERLYPELVDWWWEFRVTRFEPAGWVDSAIYDHNGFRPYVNAVYLRGALFLEGLRNLIGDEVFFGFLRDYATRGARGQVTAGEFFGILAGHSPADLGALMQEYFRQVE